MTRSLFDTARQYRESFDVYGSKKSFEWQQVEGEEPVIHTAACPSPRSHSASRCPTTPACLPEPIRKFTQAGRRSRTREHLSFIQGGGHGGSHPHLVHDFSWRALANSPPCPTPRPRPTGRWSASAPPVGHEGGRAGADSGALNYRGGSFTNRRPT